MKALQPESPLAGDDEARVGRRGFLGAITASLALAGAEGCRRAVEHVVPYAIAPERIVPGIPLHYASVTAQRGEAVGIVVESHEGRPTKIEGNPLHPSSLGAASLWMQASIIDLYDPDRLRAATRMGSSSTWESFEADCKARLSEHTKDGGARLRALVTPSNSPTERRMRRELLSRFPRMKIHSYAPVEEGNAERGGELAYSQPVTTTCAFDRAKVILSLDSDFLQTEAGSLRAQKLFAAGRRLSSPRDTMSRLYVVEPALTATGMAADHRLALAASQVPAFVIEVAKELARHGVSFGELDAAIRRHAGMEGTSLTRWIRALARDLIAGADGCAIVVGSRQPPMVHALAHALNEALGSVGKTVFHRPLANPTSIDGPSDIAELAAAMREGKVASLFILGGNPAYDAPADTGFAAALRSVAWTAHLSLIADETSAVCTWQLPGTHELEAWGDQIALDGTVSVQQPLILPLYGGRSQAELLALLAGAPGNGRDIVRATLRDALLAGLGLAACASPDAGKLDCKDVEGKPDVYPIEGFEHAWKKSLHDGVLPRLSTANVSGRTLDARAIATALDASALHEAPNGERLEIVFTADAKMLDGRYANNSWLLELPDPVTKLVWDNAALVAPKTARDLGIESDDLLRISAQDRSIEIAAFVLKGTAEYTLVLPLGWGRTRAGRLGSGRGFDVYPLRTARTMTFESGVTVTKTGRRHALTHTQAHDSMEGRPLAREATLAEYRAQPHFAELERAPRRSLPLWTDVDYSKGHQWGMSIDLNACTGCSACVVACQAENNIPVVGKEEVAKGRDMQWLRLDRYFTEPEYGTDEGPRVIIQPVACVQCEEAPCENVCPVAALEHSSEGLSEVTYNRCIGTRYCANNCPYKVRRFNYLNWHNDGVWKDTNGLPPSLQLQQNPNVTVRFRGIIEKCTYCVQRIQRTRIDAKTSGRDLRDGDIATACQQTCPADAIVFGDLNDMDSRVAKLVTGNRRYALLEELGTKPRTTYLAKVRNPNPELG